MKIIDNSFLDALSAKAKSSKRLRKNFNLHEFESDPIQRLINALEPDTYIQPHKHHNPDKRELFMLVRGAVSVIVFDDSGNIEKVVHLSESSADKIVEIEPNVWHAVVSFQSNSVYFEVKNGPYSAEDDKIFAPWAPFETDSNALSYLKNLKKSIETI